MTNREAFTRACNILVGGVNSPVRAFRAVGGEPPCIAAGKDASLVDIEGKSYIDYVCSWGAVILGHAHPAVVAAVQHAAAHGLSFGAPTLREIELAEIIRDALPTMERIRFVNSGTEATMSALRLARGVTGRNKIIKFSGGYHGHADTLLVKAGSGALTLGEPDSAGVPAEFAKHTLVARYNHPETVAALFEKFPDDIAAVIVEPVAGNFGCVLPHEGFLPMLRRLCNDYNALLIFDEVMTGFRVAWGGAQMRFGVTPDLTCLGKVIGGGLPIGAYGGRKELMQKIAPLGPVYQAGTLSGNPLSMAAGIATLTLLRDHPALYEILETRTRALCAGLAAICKEARIGCQTAQLGGMWGFYFTDHPIHSVEETTHCNSPLFKTFFHAMLRAGVNLAPSPFESAFVTTAHTDDDISATLNAARNVLVR